MLTCLLARFLKVIGVTRRLPQLKVCLVADMYFEYVESKNVIAVTYCRLLDGSLYMSPPASN